MRTQPVNASRFYGESLGVNKNISEAVSPAERHERVSMLAVGAWEEWQNRQPISPLPDAMAFVAFHEVSRDLLDRLRPSAVVSPALAKGFDCIDLALLLSTLNYQGIYRALSDDLPKPQLIEAEIAQICPRLDFEIVTMY